MKRERTYKRIEAVRKAGEILRYLGNEKEPRTAQEIAAAVSLAQGTTMCHLATLEDLRFVQRVGEHWLIGMGLAVIWARARANLEEQKTGIGQQIEELDSGLRRNDESEDRTDRTNKTNGI